MIENTIQLEPLWHEGQLYISIRGKLIKESFATVNNWIGRRYSATHQCYLLLYKESDLVNLKDRLSTFSKVELNGWGKLEHGSLPEPLTKAWISIPSCYAEKLRIMRYSEATAKNYKSQFKSFLSFIYPKTCDTFEEVDVNRFML